MFKRFLLGLGIIGGSIFLFMVLAGNRQAPEKKPVEERSMAVETISVSAEDVRFKVASQGAIQPRTETSLAAEVTGKVVSVSDQFVAGGFFQKGDVLLQIDPSDYEVALTRAEASLAGNEARLAEEVARATQAEEDWKKLEGRRGQANDLVLRKPQLAEAQANVRSAEADVIKARRDLERTTIRAPYTGLIRSKQVDVGQFVTMGTVLGSTFAVDQAEIRLPVTDKDLAFLNLPSPGQQQEHNQPTVMLAGQASGHLTSREARIVRTEGVIDDNTRVTYLVARLEDPYSVLNGLDMPVMPIGTFVNAEIIGVEANDVIVLPSHALRNDNTVLLADADNKLEVRPVEVLKSEDNQTIISSGLASGDRVILTSINIPIPGTNLSIIGEPQAEAVAAGAAADGPGALNVASSSGAVQ